MVKFRKGQKVIVKHQRDLGIMTVENGFEPLPEPIFIHSLNREVDGYVIIGNGKHSGLGYHNASLELVE